MNSTTDTSDTQTSKPKTGMRPNNFDLIRLLAATQVVIYHGIEHLGLDSISDQWWVKLLECFPGVPIFFVLSGFLVSASYERSKSLTQYAANRALRIFPGLWCCLAFSIAVVLLLQPEAFQQASITHVGAWLAAQLTMFQFYNPDFLRSFGVGTLNGSLWTIPVELQFYIALPVVYWLFNRNKRITWRWLIGCFLVGMAVNQVLYVGLVSYREAIWFKLIGCSMIPHIWLFLLGVLLQQNFERLRPFFEGKFAHWLIGHGLMVIAAGSAGLPVGSNYPFPGVALTLAGSTIALAFTVRTLADKLLHHNDISYGVYIYHMVLVNAFIHMNFTGTVTSLICLVVATFVIAYLSWTLIERPAIKLKKRWQVKQSTA